VVGAPGKGRYEGILIRTLEWLESPEVAALVIAAGCAPIRFLGWILHWAQLQLPLIEGNCSQRYGVERNWNSEIPKASKAILSVKIVSERIASSERLSFGPELHLFPPPIPRYARKFQP